MAKRRRETSVDPADAWRDQIVCGDSRKVLPQVPDEVADAIITSPPYFQQRDYGDRRQIGREAQPQQYVERLVKTFA